MNYDALALLFWMAFISFVTSGCGSHEMTGNTKKKEEPKKSEDATSVEPDQKPKEKRAAAPTKQTKSEDQAKAKESPKEFDASNFADMGVPNCDLLENMMGGQGGVGSPGGLSIKYKVIEEDGKETVESLSVDSFQGKMDGGSQAYSSACAFASSSGEGAKSESSASGASGDAADSTAKAAAHAAAQDPT